MDMKITQRDKRLLSLLVSVLIIVGFVWYLIVPTMKRLDNLDMDIEEAQIAKQEMQAKMALYPDYQEQFATLQNDVKQATQKYYDRMTSQEVDRELTNIVIANGLECIGLKIDPLIFTEAKPYTRSELARQSSKENGSSSSKKDKNVQEQIYTCKVRMTVEGDEELYQKLTDLFVNSYPAIRVTGISYKKGQARMVVQEDGSSQRQDGMQQLVLNMEMYMCDKQLSDQVETADTEGENP